MDQDKAFEALDEVIRASFSSEVRAEKLILEARASSTPSVRWVLDECRKKGDRVLDAQHGALVKQLIYLFG